MESTQHKPDKDSIKRKEKKKFNTFFTTVSAITVQEAEGYYKNGDMPKINKNKEEDREMKRSLLKKLCQSWMCCSKQKNL